MLSIKEFKVQEDGGYFLIPLDTHNKSNDAIGDQIGYDKEYLWFYDGIDIDDEEIREFIKNNFKNYRAIYGFIRRVLD